MNVSDTKKFKITDLKTIFDFIHQILIIKEGGETLSTVPEHMQIILRVSDL